MEEGDYHHNKRTGFWKTYNKKERYEIQASTATVNW
jgi:hypothetical protein